MAKETERRFIPIEGFDPAAHASETLVIRQSYLPIAGDMIVRLRQTIRPGRVVTDPEGHDDLHPLHEMETKRRESALTNEGERQTLEAAMYRSLRQAAGNEIVKLRHLVEHDGRTWEVDVYHRGDPSIPMIAEIEFETEKEALLATLPDWAGNEVTGDHRYSNERIATFVEQAR